MLARQGKVNMGLPVSFPNVESSDELPPGKPYTIQKLCKIAKITCKVIGALARTEVIIGESRRMRVVRKEKSHQIWIGIHPDRTPRRRALLALGCMAFGNLFDPAARACLYQLEVAKPVSYRRRPIPM
jgi:hypothetical protein